MFPPLAYHINTTNFFKQQANTWDFFASAMQKEEQLVLFKSNLLKSTYKFDEASEPGLYGKVAQAKEKLGMQLPVSLYQAQNTEETNASILYIGNEAHIVFSGKLIQFLTEEELLAIIGHELSHVLLYNQLNGEVEVTDRIITAIGNHANATPAHYETARLFKLYTEIFCDRGAALVTGGYSAIVSSLVKLATGLSNVNADSYIKQAEEIFSLEGGLKASGVSHPENFIRARAIHLWHTGAEKAEQTIQQMIEGSIGLDELDLFRQHQLAVITREMLQLIISPKWLQTPPVVALSKQYFPTIQSNGIPELSSLSNRIELLHDTAKEYLAYVLYDMATADKALEDIPLGYGFSISEQLSLDKAFFAAVKKERKLTDKKTKALRQQSVAEYQKIDVTPA